MWQTTIKGPNILENAPSLEVSSPFNATKLAYCGQKPREQRLNIIMIFIFFGVLSFIEGISNNCFFIPNCVQRWICCKNFYVPLRNASLRSTNGQITQQNKTKKSFFSSARFVIYYTPNLQYWKAVCRLFGRFTQQELQILQFYLLTAHCNEKLHSSKKKTFFKKFGFSYNLSSHS